MRNFVLYHFHNCPYCHKVRDFMLARNIIIPMKDIHQDDRYRRELLTIGGKAQVPCLIVDGEPLYESGKIIEWLEKNWVVKEPHASPAH